MTLSLSLFFPADEWFSPELKTKDKLIHRIVQPRNAESFTAVVRLGNSFSSEVDHWMKCLRRNETRAVDFLSSATTWLVCWISSKSKKSHWYSRIDSISQRIYSEELLFCLQIVLNLCHVFFSETIQVCLQIDREREREISTSINIIQMVRWRSKDLVNIEKKPKQSYSSNDLFSSLTHSHCEASLWWVCGKHYEIMLLGHHHHHHAKRQHQKKVSSFVDRFWKESGLQQRAQQQTINEYWYSECALVVVDWGYQSEPTDKSSLVDRALLRGRKPKRTACVPTLIIRERKKEYSNLLAQS